MRTRGAAALLQHTGCLLQTARAQHRRARALCARPPHAAAVTSNLAPTAELPFTLKEVDVTVSDWGAVRLVVPASEDEVLDHFIAANRGDADPFFCSIWPSSIALAANVLKQPRLVAGKRVIDVGCGLGLAGVAAALAGAHTLVLSDREPFALRCSLLAARANGLFPTASASCDAAAAEELCRLQALLAAPAAAGRGAVSALQLDWHAPPAELRGAFDVMLCADVLYDKSAADPVAALALHLLAPGGVMLLADPPLRTPAIRERFFAAVDGKLELTSDELQSIFDADAKPVDVRFCVFRRIV